MAAIQRALIIGINEYQMPGADLKGCVNDALTMAKLATEHFGFPREEVRLLTDSRATTANIRSRLQWLVNGAGPGSRLYFHFSGHGAQVRDRGEKDELDDGLDEILCPYDLDWDDPFTDDELRAAIDALPEGVNFTIVLDCCHSGTGTRDFFKEPELRGSAKRFLCPPPDIAFRYAAGVELTSEPERSVNMSGRRPGLQVRHFGQAATDQKAILISGCRSDQTSADAWIENDYRGALSYSLYRAVKLNNYQVSYGSLIREAGDWLEANGYSQVPQLECPNPCREWSFLDTREHTPASSGPAVVTAPGGGPQSHEIALAPTTRVVCVHGIGDHASGYSDRWRAVFNRYLALGVSQFHEVVWDEVFDERERGKRSLAEPPSLTKAETARAEELGRELEELLRTRIDLVEDIVTGDDTERAWGAAPVDRTADRGFLSWLIRPNEYLGDFVRYLSSEKVRRAIDRKALDVLQPLIGSGHPVVVLSHSWGSVVTHNALRQIDSGQVALHVSMGSPLWMLPVRRMLDLNGRRNACRNWINVDARGDLIGGRLAEHFDVHHDYKVPSVGGSPHGSYFHPDNATVQRDIVAAACSEVARELLSDTVIQPVQPSRSPSTTPAKRKSTRKS